MKYLSLFSGIGGFELGIQQAYKSNNEHAHLSEESESEERPQGRVGATHQHEIQLHDRDRTAPLYNIGYSEIDKYAIDIYQKHFPEQKNYGDIRKINPKKLPDFDLLVGGFPCQAFSIAGKRKGFKDTRGTLFFEIARILRSKKPKLFLLENVKGLLSHDNGDTFKTIISTLTKLGYDVQWQVLNSKNFGVPQNRERVFIVGHLRGTSRPKIFPFTENNSEDIVLPTITTRVTADSNGTYVGKRSPHQIIGGSQGNRVYDPKGISTTLASQAGGLGAKTGLYAMGNLKSKTWFKKTKIRRLTPTECERLQGFPDGWTEGVSDTQRYKVLGNAVTTNVVEAIISKLLQWN